MVNTLLFFVLDGVFTNSLWLVIEMKIDKTNKKQIKTISYLLILVS
ncbi:hypothetical protein VIBNIWn13_240009 [Vibrio nigripulchritudo Wn13]|nr:hypothetical protein VIBNIBLFn1_150009 [Vibrio nigripulchritudo BLFn1]CCO38297.1 hypothetical protein VIBNISFn135_10048 [Vibrio nigripulchritudo SFn135]CCO52118.1 hypothetical protein VIBNIWn13_240009 [Vibrio nigripulchritudo Wn13]